MHFLKKQALDDGWAALALSGDRIAIAEVARRPDARPQVRACDSFACEGTPLDALKRLRNAKRLARNRCATLLEHGQYQILQVDAPGNLPDDVSREELRETMRWRVKEMVDFAVDQAGIDVLEIPAQGGRNRQLWVVAASHAVLRPCVELFQDARLPLEAIDIPEFAQRNLASLFEEPERGLALVAFDVGGRGGGRLTITYQGELYMTRHLDMSGSELANPGAGALRERVLLDIQRSLDNFDRNFGAISLSRLLVAPLPNGDDFVAYLHDNLSLPVAKADLADVLDLAATPRLRESGAQAEAWLVLGTALRD